MSPKSVIAQLHTRSRRRRVFAVVLLAAFLAATAFTIRRSYENYRDALIRQEEIQILSATRIIESNLNNFVSAELDKMDVSYSTDYKTLEEVEDKSRYLITDRYPLYRNVICLDPDGSQQGFWYVNAKACSREESEAYAGRQSLEKVYRAQIVGKEYSPDTQDYILYVKKSINILGELHTLLFAVDMSEIYKQIIKPVEITAGGFAYLQDEDGVIIMHDDPGQIGTNPADALLTHKSQSANGISAHKTQSADGISAHKTQSAADGISMRRMQSAIDSLLAWYEKKLTASEGKDVVVTYQTTAGDSAPVRQEVIAAFTRVNIQNQNWIITSTIPAGVLSDPLNAFMRIATAITAVIVMLVIATVLVIQGYQEQKRTVQYLREINDGMETVQKLSDEVRHYQRVQALGLMSSHIAHEFNNFLTPVMVYADLLSENRELSESDRHMLEQMIRELDKAKTLSADLLSFSRQDSGSKMTWMDLREAVLEAVSMVERLTPAAISLETAVTSERTGVVGRDGCIDHILLNLCKNSFNAMEDSREKVLRISLTRTPDGEALLAVRDTGCGIPEEMMANIFEPFYTTKGSRQGTGLGLSVVRNIVESMNGRIDVESSENGTEFRLYFPVEAEREERRLPEIRRVLFLHDGQIDEKRIAAIFADTDCAVEFYDHPAAVIAKIQENRSCCGMVISSYQLPAMNGIEALEIIRRLNPEIRLILTADRKAAEFAWYLNNGMIDRCLDVGELYRELAELAPLLAGRPR